VIKKKVHLSVETNLHWQSIFKISGCNGQNNPRLGSLVWLNTKNKKIQLSVIKETYDKILHKWKKYLRQSYD